MLRNWNYVKNRVHDASGVTEPKDWKWEKDERMGIYYPIYFIGRMLK